MAWYGLGSRWYDLIHLDYLEFILYTLLSLYISAAHHLLHALLLASVQLASAGGNSKYNV